MTDKETKVTAQTWIPIGVALAGLVAFFWFGVSYSKILTNQENQDKALTRIEQKVDQQNQEAVTVRSLRQWIELLKARNPGNLTIPDFPR